MGLTNSPKISVIMSCYNSAAYLEGAIESILNQSLSDLEFIIIDDGSRDETPNLIRHYETMDTRVVTFKKKNSGLADSLNLGLEKARGSWIARLDTDDISLPGRLQKQYDYLQTRRDIIALGSGCIEINKEGKEIVNHHYPQKHFNLVDHIARGLSPFPHSSVLFCRKAANQLGGYRLSLNGAEDVDLWLRMSEIGKIGTIREPLIKLRKHPDSISANSDRHIILGYMARTSYWIRKQGHKDPIDDQDMCDHFYEYVKNQLLIMKVFERNRAVSELRTIFRRNISGIGLGPLVSMINIMRGNRHGLHALWQRIVNTNIPIKLANRWIS
jgi:glycosyltransferase involved in cell wall biosynthesis